jgi:hypothetical protein
MRVASILNILITLILGTLCAACGGSGGGESSEGTVIQGTLTQTGLGHSAMLSAKHAAGERIEDVKICVLSECSITDGQGQWGVNVDNLPGGEVIVTVNGHGIDSQTSVFLPETAREVVIELGRDGNIITVSQLLIDGEDHTGHNHEH